MISSFFGRFASLFFPLLPLGGLLLLVACTQGALDLGDQPKPGSQVSTAVPLSSNVNGEKVGDGPVRVALLVPQSAGGAAGTAGKQLANAAKLAMRDFAQNRMQLVIKDTKGQAAGAQLGANEAVREGATLVLGPLFSANVSAASAVTKPSSRPMIAFSSDMNRASAGTYLLSFAPQDDVARTLNAAAANGNNRVIAILPSSPYGNLVLQEMQRLSGTGTIQIIGTSRYGTTDESIRAAARQAAPMLAGANALFIPDGGEVPSALVATIAASGGSLNGVQLLGSGQWDTVDRADRRLNGAIYAGPPKQSFETFASRYQATYGERPVTTAALAYDAVSLTAELIRRNPAQPFTAKAIQSPSGFAGATGLFRFRANGRIDRGLAVYRLVDGAVVEASAAPRSFSGLR